MESLDFYKQEFGDTPDTELMYYMTYLIQTDYVAAKVAECLYLGTQVESKYTDVLQQRQAARDRIDVLQGN